MFADPVCPHLLPLPVASGGLQNALSDSLRGSTPDLHLALQNKNVVHLYVFVAHYCRVISANAVSPQYPDLTLANDSTPLPYAFIPLLIAV